MNRLQFTTEPFNEGEYKANLLSVERFETFVTTLREENKLKLSNRIKILANQNAKVRKKV